VPAAIGLAPAGAAIPTVFFFSEYVEGSGFNKAVEIFNGTGASIDLGALGYTLELYSNGAAIPSQTVARSGTVADGDVFVVSRADAVFTVAFSRPLGQDITVRLVPIGITALPVVDFDLRLPCDTLAAGETNIDLCIPVRGDRQRERDETLGVVALATGGVRHDPLATATIVNDD
jgi:hypothetical protein